MKTSHEQARQGWRGATAARLSALTRDVGGVTAVHFALLLPMLMLVLGATVDYAMAISQHSRLQTAADAAAVAGAKELSLSDAKRESVPAVVEAVVMGFLKGNDDRITQSYDSKTTIVDTPGQPIEVIVDITSLVRSQFGEFYGLGDVRLTTRSVAKVVGRPNICLLALDASANGTITLQKDSKVIGQNCAVYSNSRSNQGIKSKNSAMLHATVICSAGGKDGEKGNFEPQPILDCPQFEDPLAGRPEPSIGGCTQTDLVIDSQDRTLLPGTYCGGITVKGSAKVKLKPGVYVISNGPLLVDGTASFTGESVGFFLSGPAARLRFNTSTTIDLSAPKDGAMAGLLFFASRSQGNITHAIMSDNARNLLGTIYIPAGTLSIDANKPIADQSAYTAVVVRKLIANSGPTVMLNTNYDSTDVPVPEGIRGAGQPVALAR